MSGTPDVLLGRMQECMLDYLAILWSRNSGGTGEYCEYEGNKFGGGVRTRDLEREAMNEPDSFANTH